MHVLAGQTASALDLSEKEVKLNHVANLGWHFRITRKVRAVLRSATLCWVRFKFLVATVNQAEKNLRKHKEFTTLETRKDGGSHISSCFLVFLAQRSTFIVIEQCALLA